MSGAFGLLGDPHPSHFPLDRLVEKRARLDPHKLNRIGGFAEGTITRLAWGQQTYHLARHAPNILINGNRVMVVWDEQARPLLSRNTGNVVIRFPQCPDPSASAAEHAVKPTLTSRKSRVSACMTSRRWLALPWDPSRAMVSILSTPWEP
jgi:hypothetical protein